MNTRRAAAAVSLSLLLGTSLVACGGGSTGPAIVVTATDTTCEAAQTAFDPGPQRFALTNKGTKVNELYLYASGSRVVAEVENVGPGATRTLSVDLKAGSYELACKPGQVGNGIRQSITVRGQAAPVATAARSIPVSAVDYSFSGMEEATIKAGETLKVVLNNAGAKKHEIVIEKPGGGIIGEIENVQPATSGEADFTFATAGTYRFYCDTDDHRSRGMQGTVTVGS